MREVKWEELDIQKQSIMELFNGKFIKAKKPNGEQFMLAFGHDRSHYKSVLIDISRTRFYIRFNQSESENLSISTSVAFDLNNYLIPEVMEYYDYTLLKER